MATIAATKPHPIFLAGRWVDSPDVLEVSNPANGEQPAGATYNATEEQYEQATEAAVKAFEVTRNLRPMNAARSCATSATASRAAGKSSAG